MREATILRPVLALAAVLLMAAGWLSLGSLPARADAAFSAFLEALRPEAEARGVSRATFDRAFAGLQPDRSLPDLEIPGRANNSSAGQAEFTRAPSEYLDNTYLMRLAATGRDLAKKHKAVFDAIEAETGVDRHSLLAIWGRETAFGAYKLPHDAIRVLATQAYLGRRKDVFRAELLAALKLLQDGMARADMQSSWAGAVGLTQFMPTEFALYAHDQDGDGKIDIKRSVPDALGSAARQLKGKGWVAGEGWGFEVVIPPGADCGFEGPTQTRKMAEWAKLGFKRVGNKPWPESQMGFDAYLMSPAGTYGPSFLVTENFKVFRLYNMSDLYAVFVGHLADRIAGGGDFVTPWGGTGPQKTRTIEEIQKRLQGLGYDVEKIDGKIGSNTRKVIGTYQRTNNLRIDCWPSDAVLAHLRTTAAR